MSEHRGSQRFSPVSILSCISWSQHLKCLMVYSSQCGARPDMCGRNLIFLCTASPYQSNPLTVRYLLPQVQRQEYITVIQHVELLSSWAICSLYGCSSLWHREVRERQWFMEHMQTLIFEDQIQILVLHEMYKLLRLKLQGSLQAHCRKNSMNKNEPW